MKIVVTQILPSPSGLRCGLRIEGPQGSWLRFAEAEVPYALVTDDVRQALTEFLNRRPDLDVEPKDQPIDFDW